MRDRALEKTRKSDHNMGMSVFVWYVLPLGLIALSLSLRPIAAWLQTCAKGASVQYDLAQKYQDNAARFLKLSDPVEHQELRMMVIWFGANMLNGTQLIQFMIFSGKRLQGTEADAVQGEPDAFKNLTDDAKHALARAIGYALVVSSFQSFFSGQKYRSMLFLMLDRNNHEMKHPEQIVMRYKTATKFNPIRLEAA